LYKLYFDLFILCLYLFITIPVMGVLNDPESVKIITDLGYPAYLTPFLGVARILALLVIFIPNFRRLKEWAYAGLVFDLIGAIYSIIAVGGPAIHILIPIITLAIMLSSYFLHHKRLN